MLQCSRNKSLTEYEKGKRIYLLRKVFCFSELFGIVYHKYNVNELNGTMERDYKRMSEKKKSWASIFRIEDEVQNQHWWSSSWRCYSYIMHSLTLTYKFNVNPPSFFVPSSFDARDFNFFFVVHSCTILTQLVLLFMWNPIQFHSFFFFFVLLCI